MLASHSTPDIQENIVKAEPLWKAAHSLGYPSAVWRLPQSNTIKLLISLTEGVQKRKPDLESLPSCFLIHPFESQKNGEAFLLEGDLIYTFTDTGHLHDCSNKLGDEHPLVKRFLETVREFAENKVETPSNWQKLTALPDPDERKRYTTIVSKAISAIKAGELTKIVLSRTKTFSYSEQFDPFVAFQKLNLAYPSAFVSLVSLPEQGEVWLGATPETLVSVNAKGIFKTTSLAGTQLVESQDIEKESTLDIRWGQKEIQEQALVSRYIVECFKKIRLREYSEKGPWTVKAGNLYHLRTDFVVNTGEVNFPELGTIMLELLHPTSAVCGSPKENALRFISTLERYDRSFYSGYLGPVQVDQESSLFVNLRTLRLANGKATLFAGAGITEDSDPEREWLETEMKCDTLLRVLI